MSATLGTLEFCAALNGDDLDQKRNVLKRFVRIVREERREAFLAEDQLSSSDGGDGDEDQSDYSSDSDREDVNQTRPTKKSKVESWKMDTMAYNVPFVGTSTHKGSSGVVKHECWPTGFLEAYLDQSPQATELLGKEFQRSLKKLDDKAFNLRSDFLQAVGELVSCAITSQKVDMMENRADLKLKESSPFHLDEMQPCHQKIVSIIMKEHTKELFTILNEHSFSGSHHKLLISVLTTLKMLANTSVGTAREIARGIDTHVKDGVLQKLASFSSPKKKKKDDMESGVDDDVKRKAISLKVQGAFLDFATSLLEYNDSSIMSYISSAGTKESKLKAGILYLGLRSGLNQGKIFVDNGGYANQRTDEAYQLSLFYLLRFIRTRFCDRSGKDGGVAPSRMRSGFSNKTPLQLFRGDTLEKMIHIYCTPPKRSDRDETVLSEIKNECNKTINIVFTDNKNSPFLTLLYSERTTDNSPSIILQQMNKALQYLLAISPSVDTRQFVSVCFKCAPALFPNWLRTLSLPDPKPSFACLSMFSLIGFMLKTGPAECVADSVKFEEGDGKKVYSLLVANILPRALTKNMLTKAIQSSNPFMATQTLKLVAAILRRFKKLAKNAFSGDEKKLEFVAEKLAQRMPDLQVILAIRSKFEPNADNSEDQKKYQHHSFVTMNLCMVLQLYASIFPNAFRTVQFDWTKLLSNSPKTFLSAPLSLQHRIFDTMSSIHKCLKHLDIRTNSMYSVKAHHMFTSVLLQTKSKIIFKLVRRLVVDTIACIVDSSRLEKVGCSHSIDYEIAFWVDGITVTTAAIFGKLLDAVQKVTFQHTTVVSNAWSTIFPSEEMPKITFTPLLSIALVGIASSADAFPSEFITLTHDVFAKILFLQPDTRVLACLFKNLFETQYKDGDIAEDLKGLYSSANSVICDNDGEIYTSECRVAANAFGKKNVHTIVARLAKPQKRPEAAFGNLHEILLDCDEVHDVATLIVSQCIHHLHQTHSSDLFKVIQNALPYVLQGKMNTFMCENILQLALSSENCSLMLLLGSCFVDIDDSSQQDIIRGNISTRVASYWRGTVCAEENTIPRQVLLLTAGTSQVLGSETNSSFGAICRICSDPYIGDESLRSYLALLLKVIQKFWINGNRCITGKQLSTFDVEEVFKLWLLLSSRRHESGTAISPETPLLLSRLEVVIASFITDTEAFCLQSTILVKCIKKRSIDLVLGLSYKNVINDDVETDDGSRCAFIESLLVYDVSMFAAHTMRLLDNMSNKETTGEFRHKDEIIALLVREIHLQKHCSPKIYKWYPSKVGNLMVNSFCSAMQHLIDGQAPHETFVILLEALSIMITQSQLCVEHINEVYQSASMLMHHWKGMKRKDVPKVTEKAFLSFLSKISLPCSMESSSDANRTFQTLCNTTLSYTAKTLPRAIKAGFVNEEKNSAMLFLSIISNLIKASEVSEISCLQEILVLCLKFGIGAVDDQFSPKCLAIARLIILSVHAHGKKSTKVEIFAPSQIHSMILSHSNFDDLASTSSRTRTELLALLICTVSSSEHKINVGWEKMTKLLIPFRAGLSTEDYFLRRLLYLHDDNNQMEKDEAFFMHEVYLRNSLDSTHNETQFRGNSNAQQWEHFIEALDTRRTRRTINRFPLNDPVRTQAIPNVEACLEDEQELGDKMQNDNESVDSDDNSEDDSLPDISSNSQPVDKKDREGFTLEDKEEDDDRYSPGFILPFVLEVLESFAQQAETEEESPSMAGSEIDTGYRKRSYEYGEKSKPQEETISNPKKEIFAKVAYRLFQKSALALSVASLSSKCPELRNIAIAVIYRFLQALQMRETQKLALWRSRPQVEMMVNSLQRGLLVMRAQKIMQNSHDKDELNVAPMLPAANTLFLARSLLILANPSDDMYGPMNKSFLRLAPYHGAYTGCFSLPAFMTLFCSMNENPDQARKERLWALRLLKDGTVDSYCYRMASRRHVPELLLTSFDAILSKEELSSDEEDECLSLLETIQSLIQRGGSSSFYHYFNAVGILSWVQSSLQANILSPSIKSSRIALKFLEVLEAILEKTVEQSNIVGPESPSCPQFDIVKVARGVTEVFKNLFKEYYVQEQKMHRNDVIPQSTSLTCQILWLLCELQESIDDTLDHSYVIHPNGLPIETCIDIIQTTKKYTPSLLGKTIFALSSLPFDMNSLKEEQNAVMVFCQEAIQSILSTEDVPALPGTLSPSIILKRIADLSSSVFTSDHGGSSFLIQYLFGSRRVLVTKYSCSAEWFECLRTVVDKFKLLNSGNEHQIDYTKLLTCFDESNVES